MPMIKPTQQRRAQGLAIIGGPLVDHQPATRVEALLAVFQETPGQVPDTRADIGIKVDEDQVCGFGSLQQFQGIADANVQPWIIVQPQVFDGQAWHIGTQFDGFDVFQGQKLQAGLSQGPGAEAEKQRAFRVLMAQGTDQHGAGVVVLQPARIGSEHAALLDGVAKLEKAVIGHFQHPDHAELIVHFGEQVLDALLSHLIS